MLKFDTFPQIPAEEYPLRWKKLQQLLLDKKLDALIAYADDRATYGQAYARYYAAFPVHFEPVLLLFTPDREPLFLCGPETAGFASEVGTMPNIRVLAEFAAEDEDYPFIRVEKLSDIIKESVGSVKRLGMCGVHLMGADVYCAIMKVFKDAEIVRMEGAVDNLRGVKTEAELQVIRRCYEIAEIGMQAGIDAVAPGVTEREIAARIESVMRLAGAEGTGIDTIVASGPNTNHILARTTFRKVEENDVVLITVAPRYMGYHGAIGRTIVVGNPGEKVIASIKAEIRAQETCQAALCPGKVGADVEALGRQVMTEAGYGENFMYSGLHSVGVTEFEPPILGPSSTTVLEKNMVISVDIPLFEADVTGSRTEDGYILTDDGAVHLSAGIPRFIQK